VPIFRFPEEGDGSYRASASRQCPSCHTPRQLQIFFAGYAQKEKSTQQLMKELTKFLAPQIGCVLTVGFSGLWDQALIDFISLLCTDLDRESRVTRSPNVSCICVDSSPTPNILQALAHRGIAPLHLQMK